MNQRSIHSVHIYVLIIMSTGFMVHVLELPIILSLSHRDSWVSVLFSIIPFLLWIFVLSYIYKKLKDRNLFDLLKRLPKWLSLFFSFMICTYLLFKAFVSLKFTLYWANDSYTMDIPDFIVVLLFACMCWFASEKGIRTICIMSMLLIPFVVFFGFLVGLGNMQNKDYSQLFPIFENGYQDIFISILTLCGGYFEMTLYLFLTPFLHNKLKTKWLFVVGLILVELTLGPVMGALTEFGPVEAAKLRNPAFEQWRLLMFGVNITRLDFLSIFQWISGVFIRVSLSLFLANKMISFRKDKKRKWMLIMLYLIVMIAVLIHWNATSFIYFLVHFYFLIDLVLEIFILIVLLFLIRLKGEISS